MWDTQLRRASNGHFSNLLSWQRSSPLAVTAPQRLFPKGAPTLVRACSPQVGSWRRSLWSGVLAASLLGGPWTGCSSQAGVLESSHLLSDARPYHAMKQQQASPLRQVVRNSNPEAPEAAMEAATDVKPAQRSEGYIMAKGHNGQINRLYYSVPKDQVATQNALFFVGDYVDGDGDSVIERLNTGEGIAATLVPKLDPRSNLFIVYPSAYQDRIWACYTSMLPATSSTGEPLGFSGKEPVAARQLGALLQDALRQLSRSRGGEAVHGGDSTAGEGGQAAARESGDPEEPLGLGTSGAVSRLPTFVMGFSKGGVVLNELMAEMAALEDRMRGSGVSELAATETGHSDTGPSSGVQSDVERLGGGEAFLESISEVHYVDVGLICPGAYLTDPQKLGSVVRRGSRVPLTIGLHGTPRQWAEKKRPWIGGEKDRMLAILQAEAAASEANGGFQVFERRYCEGQKVGMRMHFDIIDLADFANPCST